MMSGKKNYWSTYSGLLVNTPWFKKGIGAVKPNHTPDTSDTEGRVSDKHFFLKDRDIYYFKTKYIASDPFYPLPDINAVKKTNKLISTLEHRDPYDANDWRIFFVDDKNQIKPNEVKGKAIFFVDSVGKKEKEKKAHKAKTAYFVKDGEFIKAIKDVGFKINLNSFNNVVTGNRSKKSIKEDDYLVKKIDDCVANKNSKPFLLETREEFINNQIISKDLIKKTLSNITDKLVKQAKIPQNYLNQKQIKNWSIYLSPKKQRVTDPESLSTFGILQDPYILLVYDAKYKNSLTPYFVYKGNYYKQCEDDECVEIYIDKKLADKHGEVIRDDKNRQILNELVHQTLDGSDVFPIEKFLFNPWRKEEIFPKHAGYYTYPWFSDNSNEFSSTNFEYFTGAVCLFGAGLQVIDNKDKRFALFKHGIEFHNKEHHIKQIFYSPGEPNSYENSIFKEAEYTAKYVNEHSDPNPEITKHYLLHIPYWDYMLHGLSLLVTHRFKSKDPWPKQLLLLEQLCRIIITEKEKYTEIFAKVFANHNIKLTIQSPFENAFGTISSADYINSPKQFPICEHIFSALGISLPDLNGVKSEKKSGEDQPSDDQSDDDIITEVSEVKPCENIKFPFFDSMSENKITEIMDDILTKLNLSYPDMTREKKKSIICPLINQYRSNISGSENPIGPGDKKLNEIEEKVEILLEKAIEKNLVERCIEKLSQNSLNEESKLVWQDLITVANQIKKEDREKIEKKSGPKIREKYLKIVKAIAPEMSNKYYENELREASYQKLMAAEIDQLCEGGTGILENFIALFNYANASMPRMLSYNKQGTVYSRQVLTEKAIQLFDAMCNKKYLQINRTDQAHYCQVFNATNMDPIIVWGAGNSGYLFYNQDGNGDVSRLIDGGFLGALHNNVDAQGKKKITFTEFIGNPEPESVSNQPRPM